MHKTSYNTMKHFLSTLDSEASLNILDVGSLRVSKQSAYVDLIPKDSKWSYQGIDLCEGPNVNVVAQYPTCYPFPADTFDVIICGQTLEHTANPVGLLLELRRILKPGGRMCIIAPSAGYEHHNPDYWRIMPDGMEFLMETAGLIDIKVTLNPAGIWRDCVGTAKKRSIQ